MHTPQHSTGTCSANSLRRLHKHFQYLRGEFKVREFGSPQRQVSSFEITVPLCPGIAAVCIGLLELPTVRRMAMQLAELPPEWETLLAELAAAPPEEYAAAYLARTMEIVRGMPQAGALHCAWHASGRGTNCCSYAEWSSSGCGGGSTPAWQPDGPPPPLRSSSGAGAAAAAGAASGGCSGSSGSGHGGSAAERPASASAAWGYSFCHAAAAAACGPEAHPQRAGDAHCRGTILRWAPWVEGLGGGASKFWAARAAKQGIGSAKWVQK